MAMFYIVTLLKALFGMLGLILQGESLDTSFGLLDPVTVTFECRSLPEGVAVEESRRPRGVMRRCIASHVLEDKHAETDVEEGGDGDAKYAGEDPGDDQGAPALAGGHAAGGGRPADVGVGRDEQQLPGAV
ncbi:hypothetical protein TRIUR3_06218 [Triticum urartu]|uniref:Uncharacterized protein n=1 Tax=Triticum urartu TaxID=4572 RepID=M7ZPV9_TRIUA|nr:hypothetical protein TRIUR3_06218 [Triticum urartu]